MNYRSINQMNEVLRSKFRCVIREEVDLIVGVPRSGLMPAVILSELANVPMISSTELIARNGRGELSWTPRLYQGRTVQKIEDCKHIVVIDDSCSTGATINTIVPQIKATLPKAKAIEFGCVYATNAATSVVDFYFELVNLPRVFEWNIMNHGIISASCFDMDGVLCMDPTPEQNDDGEKYIDFILSATPLFIPKYEIGAIVTSRLEKYRKETEKWLEQNGVRYKNLIMLDLPSKEARIALGAHGKFKANVYNQIAGAQLFVESEPKQAKYINEVTNKPVYCTSDNSFYDDDKSFERYLQVKSICDEKLVIIDELLNSIAELQQFLLENEDNQDDNWNMLTTQMVKEIVNEVKLCGINDLKGNALEGYLGLSGDAVEISPLDVEPGLAYVCLLEMMRKRVCEVSGLVTDRAWREEKARELSLLSNEIYGNSKLYNEFPEEVEYIRKRRKLELYPYDYRDEYELIDVVVHEDIDSKLYYVLYNDKKLYFPMNRTKEDVIAEYRRLLVEQDRRCSHSYFSDTCDVIDGSIFIDVGGAEGIVSLSVIDKVKCIYIFESDSDWISALEKTFEPWKDKVHIIAKYAGAITGRDTISVDDLLVGEVGKNVFIKMDVEGMEKDVLLGAQSTIVNNNCLIAAACYHYQDEEKELKEFFNAYNYQCETNDSWMLFFYGKLTLDNGRYQRMEYPYFRHAILRAIPNRNNIIF